MRCSSNLRQLALALHQYHDQHEALPAFAYRNYAFHVALLPYLEQGALYKQFDFRVNAMDYEGPLDSTRVSVFECPSDGSSFNSADGVPFAATNYHGNSGSGAQCYGFNGMFSYGDHPLGSTAFVAFSSVTDGLAQTALLSEATAANQSNHGLRAVWNLSGSESPDQFEAFADECRRAPAHMAPVARHLRGRPWNEVAAIPPLYNHVLAPNEPTCLAAGLPKHSILTSTSVHGSIVNTARADGSVQAVDRAVEIAVWRCLGSRAGNP
jgi:hypothetical protein